MEPGQLEKEELGRNRSEISRKSSRESVCLSRKSSREGFEGEVRVSPVYSILLILVLYFFCTSTDNRKGNLGEPKEHQQTSQQTL